MKIGLSSLQPLGRALMLPIAVLPIAGLLLRLGQPDLLDIAFLSAAGQAVFSNLGLLFAVGVAVGLARDNNGAAGLAGVVGYLIAVEASKVLLTVPPEVTAGLAGDAADAAAKAFKDQAMARLGVPIGIISGLIAGDFYNRFSGLKLPDYLAFFGGRRFVPIASGLAALGLAAVLGLSFNVIDHAIDVFSRGGEPSRSCSDQRRTPWRRRSGPIWRRRPPRPQSVWARRRRRLQRRCSQAI